MPIHALVDAVETLPENVRSLYKPIVDGENKGKFILDVEGVNGYQLENVTGLKSAYATQKSEAESLKSALEGYKGIKEKPSEIAAKLKKLQELEAFDPESEADKRAAVKAKTQIDTVVAAHEAERAQAKTKEDRLNSQVEKLLIRDAATTAVVKQKGDPDLLMPFIQRHVRVKNDGENDPIVEVLDDKGSPDFAVRDGKPVPMTIDDLVAKMKSDPKFGRLFEASGQSGTGARPSQGGGGQKTMSRANFEALDAAGRVDAIKSGAVITD